jgi:hypothetical protein
MRAPVIRAVDKDLGKAGRSHLADRDLLRALESKRARPTSASRCILRERAGADARGDFSWRAGLVETGS